MTTKKHLYVCLCLIVVTAIAIAINSMENKHEQERNETIGTIQGDRDSLGIREDGETCNRERESGGQVLSNTPKEPPTSMDEGGHTPNMFSNDGKFFIPNMQDRILPSLEQRERNMQARIPC